ncbi:uncharacterized protein LOC114537201 [Dendronephthya gigantea]|uniref:uncharacterized protein LOC114537201 n=1 Tax=Dendronephthya gigantea TaxID=151771 RepID=UPI001068FA8B|nr:uncharacterized protein LOC114537201 [Dendronephthya gigantea]
MAAPRINKYGRTYGPGKALSEDIRTCVIAELLQAEGDRCTGFTNASFKDVAKRFKISHSSVSNIWRTYCERYTVQESKRGGNFSQKLNADDLELIEILKTENGSISLNEIYEILSEVNDDNTHISLSTISRAVRKHMLSGKRYSRKKISHVATQRFTQSNLLYTQIFIDYVCSKDPWRLKFFDEAGLKIPDVGTRRYGHSPVGERCVNVIRKYESPNNTLNLLVSLNGADYYSVIPGASNTMEFLNFFEEAAAAINLNTHRPVFGVGDVVIMDNLAVHQYEGGEVLEEFLGEMGIELLYTPVYSPDLNPIELCFNKIKTMLNYELKSRVHDNLPLAAMLAIEQISQEDMKGFYKYTSYLFPHM